MNCCSCYDSPLGKIHLYSGGTSLTGLYFEDAKHFDEVREATTQDAELPIFKETRRWLDIYFSGNKPNFTPLISLTGTPFQLKVWKALLYLPYGETTSYQEIGERAIDDKRVSNRAVGNAIGRNPISLIVPCHRVIRKDGGLGGYDAGLDRKKRLLELEGIRLF